VTVTIQDLGNLGELVAAIATVATLGYLAVQIRQNTRALRGTSHDSHVNRLQAWQLAIASDPALTSILFRFSRGDDLTEEEVARLRNLWNYAFVGTEALYHQHLRGNIDAEIWNSQLARVSALIAQPRFRRYWQHERSFKFTESFERVIEHEIRLAERQAQA
jgi:hypothetical protein